MFLMIHHSLSFVCSLLVATRWPVIELEYVLIGNKIGYTAEMTLTQFPIQYNVIH